jgi:glutathione S-transferase
LMNLPYVIDGDFVVSQSNACATYLGRKFGMMGDTPQESSNVEQLLCEAYDIRNGVVGFAYGRDTTPFSKYIANAIAAGGSIDKLNLWMSRKVVSVGSPEFFVGSKASAADFCIWEILDQIKSMAAFFKEVDPFQNFPFLADFLTRFKALSQNARYFDSRLANLPCNNLSAKNFGATPSGEVATPSTPRPWNGSSGLY